MMVSEDGDEKKMVVFGAQSQSLDGGTSRVWSKDSQDESGTVIPGLAQGCKG